MQIFAIDEENHLRYETSPIVAVIIVLVFHFKKTITKR